MTRWGKELLLLRYRGGMSFSITIRVVVSLFGMDRCIPFLSPSWSLPFHPFVSSFAVIILEVSLDVDMGRGGCNPIWLWPLPLTFRLFWPPDEYHRCCLLCGNERKEKVTDRNEEIAFTPDLLGGDDRRNPSRDAWASSIFSRSDATHSYLSDPASSYSSKSVSIMFHRTWSLFYVLYEMWWMPCGFQSHTFEKYNQVSLTCLDSNQDRPPYSDMA